VFERFAREARAAVHVAQQEAGRRGDRRIGTDHLLLALLRDAQVAQWVGVGAEAASDAAEQLDREALAAIGLRVGPAEPTVHTAPGRHVAHLTSGGRTVVQRALATATAEKARSIAPRHILLALLERHEPDPAATLLAALSVDQAVLRMRLTEAR
jgi:ATP-dependent Clp protease ATP-binding subunit ClpA